VDDAETERNRLAREKEENDSIKAWNDLDTLK
jgi:hypothetical protein